MGRGRDSGGRASRSFSNSWERFSAPFPDDPTGHVFLVGNLILGIPRHLSLRHPCCVLFGEGRHVCVSKGTDLRNVLPHMQDLYVVVYPDGTNGLDRPTAFETIVRHLPLKALFPEDRLGSLSQQDLKRIQEAVFRNGG